MNDVYRGILIDPQTKLPVVADDSGDKLGVRALDVKTYDQNGQPWVSPMHNGTEQGVSVSPDSGCDLPPSRRPPGTPWNGSHKANPNFRIWRIDTDLLVPAQLTYLADPDNATHGYLAPGVAMPLATYRDYVHATAGSWTEASNPVPDCTTTTLGGQLVSADRDRAARIDATAAGGNVDALIDQLRAANAGGVRRDAIIAELEAGVARADEVDNEDGAETLRTILDRIQGFCGPHARIDLE